MKSDAVYLLHILECIDRIEKDTAGGRTTFMEVHLIQDAVLRNLQILAESTQRLSDRIKNRRVDVEWQRIAALRNILVHDYLGVDLEVIWRILVQDLPVLKKAVEELVEE